MGKKFIEHSGMCGCERCAVQWDREHPSPVFDIVDDPDTLDCGCSAWGDCRCYEFEDDED